MKRIIIMSAVLALSGCTKTVKVETTETITGNDTVRTTVTQTEYDIKLSEAAKVRYDSARAELQRAKEHGDKVAEAAAQKAVNESKEVWEKTKESLRKGAAKTGNVLRKAGDKIDSTFVRTDTVVVKKVR